MNDRKVDIDALKWERGSFGSASICWHVGQCDRVELLLFDPFRPASATVVRLIFFGLFFSSLIMVVAVGTDLVLRDKGIL